MCGLSPCRCGGERVILLERRTLVVLCRKCGTQARPPKEARKTTRR